MPIFDPYLAKRPAKNSRFLHIYAPLFTDILPLSFPVSPVGAVREPPEKGASRCAPTTARDVGPGECHDSPYSPLRVESV